MVVSNFLQMHVTFSAALEWFIGNGQAFGTATSDAKQSDFVAVWP